MRERGNSYDPGCDDRLRSARWMLAWVWVPAVALVCVFCLQCKEPEAEETRGIEYFSDYFVFLSHSSDQPLVVPVDLNWNRLPESDHIGRTYKAWWGTDRPWTFGTVVDRVEIDRMPAHWSELPHGGGFFWDDARAIYVRNPAGNFTLQPGPGARRTPPDGVDEIAFTSLSSARIRTNGYAIDGVVIHEIVRVAGNASLPSFEHFTWMALKAGPEVFLFVAYENKREMHHWALRGSEYRAMPARRFVFRETEHAEEETSGRRRLPINWKIEVPALGAVFEIEGDPEAHHTGYGEEFASGLALYRQQLAVGSLRRAGDDIPVHGMIELILED